MPTYDYRCPSCGAIDSVYESIAKYSSNPTIPQHCGAAMSRVITVVPAMSGLANALAGDRHYDGMRAPDGTDISSRTKHREYMRRTGLTTVDDFKDTFRKAELERNAFRTGTHKDPELRDTISRQVMDAVSK